MSFEINVKFMSNPNLKIQVEADNSVADLKKKLETATKVPADDIKLIFKGKILKVGDDRLSDLNISADCTVHMIQNMTKTNPPESSQSTSQPQTSTPNPPQPNAFPNPGQGFGNLGGLGGFPGMTPGMGGFGNMGQGMGLDPAMIQQVMSNPQMMQMARQLMSNPAMMRNLVNNNPQLQQMSQNIPGFDEMISDPSFMQNAMGQMGMQAPPTTTPQQPNPQDQQPNINPQQANPQAPQPNLNLFQPNPLAQVPPNPAFGNQGLPDINNMMNNPMLQQYMNYMQSSQGTNPGMGMPGMFGQPVNPPNTNYEELYKDQLSHLKEMGFTNKDVNIDVLKQCYGNVEAAIEKLLNMFK